MPSTSLVGLDIGSASIRAVETTVTKDRPVVTGFGQAHLPEGTVVGGVVKDAKAVTAALRSLWATQDFTSRSVVLSVTHQQVIVREIDVTNLPAAELKRALPYLVKEHLPLPPDQAILDFYPLETPGNQETVHGLVIAAPKEAVIDTVHAVENAGLFVSQVDLACFAALRASAHLAQDTEALVDIGANGTNIIVHVDGMPKIVRTVPRGGAEITAMLATRLDIPTEKAERIKCRHGLNPAMTDDVDATESAEVVADALRPLITEIRNSFNYFQAAHPDSEVKRLALVGGGALLPGLREEMTRQLGVATFLSNPLQRVDHEGRRAQKHAGQVEALCRFRSSAAVSIGLTLGAA